MRLRKLRIKRKIGTTKSQMKFLKVIKTKIKSVMMMLMKIPSLIKSHPLVLFGGGGGASLEEEKCTGDEDYGFTEGGTEDATLEEVV